MNTFERTPTLQKLINDSSRILCRKRGERPQQNRILYLLYCHGPCSQKELMSHLSISQAATSEILQKLKVKGLVCSERDPDDRRSFLLTLTKNGETAAQENHRHFLEENDALFSILTPEERSQLHNILARLIEYWSTEEH